MFFKIGFLKNFVIFAGEKAVLESFFIKSSVFLNLSTFQITDKFYLKSTVMQIENALIND